MPSFDSTIHLGDVIMAVIMVGVIPLTRLLASTLRSLRDTVTELTFLVVGSKDRMGLTGDVAELKKESARHRNWLIEVQAKMGLKRDDRS